MGCVINLTQVYLCAIAETFITQFEGVIGRKTTGGCHRSRRRLRRSCCLLILSQRNSTQLKSTPTLPLTTDSRYGICVAYFAYRYAVFPSSLRFQLPMQWGPLDWQCRLWSWPKLDDPWLRGHDLNGSSIVSCGDNFI